MSKTPQLTMALGQGGINEAFGVHHTEQPLRISRTLRQVPHALVKVDRFSDFGLFPN
jgi:hypothetical protein